MVVSRARATSHVREGAAADRSTARGATCQTRVRHPEEQVPGAELIAFSVATGGRWDEPALRFLKRAAGRASECHPGLAALQGQGQGVVFASWLSQLSCALQKANADCILQARRVRGAEDFGGGHGWPGWEEDVEDLLRDAAAAAAAGDVDW